MPGQTVVVPVIIPGVAGAAELTLTARLPAALVPQLFVAVTVIFPFCPAEPEVTVIEVPVLFVIVQPVGTTQL
jgi:hypothetical protein